MSALFKDDEGAKLSAANENIFNGGILWALGIFLFLGLFDTLFGDLYSPTWRSKASDIFGPMTLWVTIAVALIGAFQIFLSRELAKRGSDYGNVSKAILVFLTILLFILIRYSMVRETRLVGCSPWDLAERYTLHVFRNGTGILVSKIIAR